jgi:hypothetical protein
MNRYVTRHRRGARLLVALAVGGALFGIAAAVQASIPDPAGVIHGCYKTNKGDLRVIDPSSQDKDLKSCKNDETSLYWNQTGLKGATGPQGPIGLPGPAGPSNAYTNYGGDHLIPVGDTQTIASVTLPAGSYTLSATVEVDAPDGDLIALDCSFVSAGTVHQHKGRITTPCIEW